MDKVEGSQQEISKEEVEKAIVNIRSGKAAGPSEVVSDMVKAGGKTMAESFTDLCNGIIKEGKVPDDWTRSAIKIPSKGEGDKNVLWLISRHKAAGTWTKDI